ncbi:MAG: hypothetical protein HKO13_00240 [Sphingomonas sp.]|nr:hypothetical protein [Sphingomonas sp.]
MENTRTTFGILVGFAIIGGLGLVGYKLVKPQAKPVFVDMDEPVTVIAARQIA